MKLYHFVIIILIMFAVSCATRIERKKKRLGNILKEYPQLLIQDTVRYRDTIVTEKVVHDSVFKQTDDTVIITKDKLVIKYKYNTKTDSVFIEGKCDTDTIYQDKLITIPCPDPEIYSDDGLPWWVYLIGGVLLLIIILLVIRE